MQRAIWILLLGVAATTTAQYGGDEAQENPCNLVDCVPNTRCIVVKGEAKCVPENPSNCKPEEPSCAAVLCAPTKVCVIQPKDPKCVDVCPVEAVCVEKAKTSTTKVETSPSRKCRQNEEFKECGTACEPSCKNPKPEVCTEQCVLGCQCKAGFYRDDKNNCVSDCNAGGSSKPKKCPRNEEYKECGTACEPSCANPNPQICTLQCVVGCQCKKGFFRNDKKVCVADCGGKGKPCGENEERKQCGTACEPSCSNPSPVCTKQCVLDVCQCKPGYTRDDATNKCISYDDCPKDRIIPCSEMNCPQGTTCELGRVICPFVPPCFTRQTICVSSETCETKKCPPGTECQQVTINCFVAPCPQAEPQCVPKEPSITCANVRCRGGTTCQLINNKPQCVKDEPYNPCAATTCPVGSQCRTKEVQCVKAPCYPIAECYNPADEAGGKKCGENESFKECASNCEPSCKEKSPICILSCAPGKCQCNTGFYRNSSGKCVTEAECDGNGGIATSCGVNEQFRNCTSMCEPKCDKEQVMCNAMCGPPRCQCLPGYLRNSNNSCVLREHCAPQSSHGCGVNEVYSQCSGCEKQCSGDEEMCSRQCGPPMCQCRDGYFRNSHGTCVMKEHCNKNESQPTCANLRCGFGTECQLVGSKDCLSTGGECHLQAQCVSKNISDSCALLRCAQGHECKLVEQNCTASPCIPVPHCILQGRIPNATVTPVGSDESNTTDADCGENEEYAECMPRCQMSCRGRMECIAAFTIHQCSSGCVCKGGYRRDADNRCVKPKHCHQAPGCRDNETWSSCATCEKKCGQVEKKVCRKCYSGCACDEGYVRNSDDVCILQEDCT